MASHHQTERNRTGEDREAKIVYADYKATEIDVTWQTSEGLTDHELAARLFPSNSVKLNYKNPPYLHSGLKLAIREAENISYENRGESIFVGKAS